MGKRKPRPEKWPPKWAELPDRESLAALARGEPVELPPRPTLAEVLGPELAARLPRRYCRNGP